MINLYLFNANDSAARYGIGSYLQEMIQALEGYAIKIRVVHLHAIRSEFEIEKINQVEHWYIPEVRNQHTFSGSIQKLEDYYWDVISLLRQNIKEKADLIFHFNFNQSYLLAKELKAAFDCKTVYTVHFLRWALELHGNLNRFQSLKTKPEDRITQYEQLLITTDEYESLLFKEVDKVIALSQYAKNLLYSEYSLEPDKVSVIPNGLSTIEHVLESDNYLSLRQKWRISDKESLILFVGRLQPLKGVSFLIRAFRKVLEQTPNCRLMFAGSGNYEFYMQEAKDICTKITFTGLLDKKELHELYSLADIGVLPSLTENCSYVAIEMMMHGLPMITSAAPGLAEMTEDGVSSLQVPLIIKEDKVEIDTSLLTEKMLYLLHHPEEARQLGENGRKRFEKMYSSNIFGQNMIRFYQSLFEPCTFT